MKAPIVLDNTVLTNFALVGRDDLPHLLWPSRVCTTEAAWAEYQSGVALGKLPAEAWKTLPVIPLTEEEATLASRLAHRLGSGERTCLVLAFHRQGMLATDDKRARQVAKQYGVSVTGTLGILATCVEQGVLLLPEANGLLRGMIEHGYRSPVHDLRTLLPSAK